MGLLEALSGNWTEDQNTNSAIRQGLLSAAFGAMAGRGTRLQAIGQGGLAGLSSYGNALSAQQDQRRSSLAEQMQRMQMEAMKRQQQDEQDLRGAIRGSVVQPQLPQTMDNRDVGQPGEQQLVPKFDMNRYAARLAQIGSPQALQAYQSLQKEKPQPIISKPGDIARDPTTGVQLWANPQDHSEKESDFIRTMRLAGIDPSTPQGSQILKNWLTKQSSHAPAPTAISYGSPVPVLLPGGETGYAQPPNRQGAAPQIMAGPGGKPLVKPKDDKPLTESQAKAAAFASQMQTAERELDSTPIDQSKVANQAAVAMSSGLGNFMVSPAVQRARQAQEQWAESYLRFKTGAASTEQEVLRNVKTFFPQPGDSKEVVAQKKRARQQAMSDVGIAAGQNKQSGSVRKYNPETGKIE